MNQLNIASKKTIRLLFVFAALYMNCTDISAQYYRQTPSRYFEITGGVGTRSFDIKSNIQELNGLDVAEEGFTIGVATGTQAISARLGYGSFKSSKTVRQRVDMIEKNVGFNFFPLRMAGKNSKFLKPYITTHFDFANLKFYGSYALPKPASPASSLHTMCPDAPAMEPEPQEETAEDASAIEKDQLIGKINVTRFNAGAGMHIHVPGRKNFFNFYAEATYGLVIGTKSLLLEFKDTKVSNQLTINVGVGYGLKW